MAINFPSSPTTGQVFTSGTTVYTWSGTTWLRRGRQSVYRNRIVNPAMQTSQEYAETGSSATGTFPVDQWVLEFAGAYTGGAYRYTGTPSPAGNMYRLIQNITLKSPVPTDHYYGIVQRLEGYRLIDLAWGTAQAKAAVLRFTVRNGNFSSGAPTIPGQYTIALRNANYSYSFLASYTITAADTDQTFTIPIPPITVGVWPNDGGRFGDLWFCLSNGRSDLVGVAGWQNANKVQLPGSANAFTGVGNFQIMDVGLYADPYAMATPPIYEAPDYAVNDKECRYFWQRSPSIQAGWTENGSGYFSGEQSYTDDMRLGVSTPFASTGMSNGVHRPGIQFMAISSIVGGAYHYCTVITAVAPAINVAGQFLPGAFIGNSRL